ncbi:hypothetical protein TESG_08332 [Trichophyton tonsurans CBS 112818]|uniref:Uncharacterized protein n=1 Tax=Trichophyton tonsurans (strain CBS 112818) TaxID=647933 RepID=F2RTA4_TRIT1|nr:hypothetical protein TESG_08332 [Trichophyton tonsurans CBS 112818]
MSQHPNASARLAFPKRDRATARPEKGKARLHVASRRNKIRTQHVIVVLVTHVENDLWNGRNNSPGAKERHQKASKQARMKTRREGRGMRAKQAGRRNSRREAGQERTLGSGLACRERAGPAKMSSSRRTEELAGNSLLGERPASQKREREREDESQAQGFSADLAGSGRRPGHDSIVSWMEGSGGGGRPEWYSSS